MGLRGMGEESTGASWPEWCFPGVSMSIYLPGAYSDKSVIAAEASERVARHYHHRSLPPPPLTTTTVPRRTVPCGSDKDRDFSLKFAMEAKRERERWPDIDKGWARGGREIKFWERRRARRGRSEIVEVREKRHGLEGERRMIVSMITMERKRKRDGGWGQGKGMGSNLLALT